jgi:hypothetical protein
MDLDPVLAAMIKQLPPLPDPDPAQVNAQRREYLLKRGRSVADGLDLGHVEDQDLVQLGELDCIGQHPDLPPGLAVALEHLADERYEPASQAIARLGCSGCYIGATRHWPCTATDPDPDAARGALSTTPDDPDIRGSSGLDHGQSSR